MLTQAMAVAKRKESIYMAAKTHELEVKQRWDFMTGIKVGDTMKGQYNRLLTMHQCLCLEKGGVRPRSGMKDELQKKQQSMQL